jgi:hypothetical protein
MELSPYLETLGRDLAAAVATGGPDVVREADLFAGALDASARLCLLEALSDATAEITRKLESATVEVRLRGREADLVVTQVTPAEEPSSQPVPPSVTGDGADLARITLRLPEWLKQEVERSAGRTGGSVNAWLVDAISAAVKAGPSPKSFPTPPGGKSGRRITGFAQA